MKRRTECWTGRLAATLAGGMAAIAAPACGQSATTDEKQVNNAIVPAQDDWRLEATAWLWGVGLTGDVGVRRRTANVDASFVDLLNDTTSLFAPAGRLEVGKGKWAGYLDGIYADLGIEDQSGPLGLSDLDVGITLALVDFGAMYRVGEWDPPASAEHNLRNTSIDVYGGGRYTYLQVGVDTANAGGSEKFASWVDPIIGGRVILPVSEHWRLQGSADVGGFGIGSDLTWSLTALVGLDFYLFGNPATFYAGYRGISQDYSPEDLDWDVVLHGPMIGLSLSF